MRIVAHVIAGVLERRVETGVDPQRVAPQSGDVVELAGDAGNIADAVAIRVGERLRVDLVELGVFQPGRLGVSLGLLRYRGPFFRCDESGFSAGFE